MEYEEFQQHMAMKKRIRELEAEIEELKMEVHVVVADRDAILESLVAYLFE